jgi:hypothetical protein
MTTSAPDLHEPIAKHVIVREREIKVDLVDGRTVVVPLAWFPRLAHATRAEQKRWRFIGRGQGIHWPDIDEDLSVEGILAGRPSGESQRSLKRWLESRRSRRTRTRRE